MHVMFMSPTSQNHGTSDGGGSRGGDNKAGNQGGGGRGLPGQPEHQVAEIDSQGKMPKGSEKPQENKGASPAGKSGK
ncbi:MAG: hypothetical protein M3R04_02735 [bacterium]|nr:hypothetical protein [bacterium]